MNPKPVFVDKHDCSALGMEWKGTWLQWHMSWIVGKDLKLYIQLGPKPIVSGKMICSEKWSSNWRGEYDFKEEFFKMGVTGAYV